MANIRSAEKQNRKMIKHRARNRAAMGSLRSAVVSMRHELVPAFGSVIANAMRASPVAVGATNRAFCSSLP